MIKARMAAIVLMAGLVFPALAAAVSDPSFSYKSLEAGRVAPDVFYVTVLDGGVKQAKQIPYVPQAGDSIKEYGVHRFVLRDGKSIGNLAGRDKKFLMPFDEWVEPSLDLRSAENPGQWTWRCGKKSVRALEVWRKSLPHNVAHVDGWEFKSPLRHTFYVRFRALDCGPAAWELRGPQGLGAGFAGSNHLASEAIHVNLRGYRPDDPLKRGTLSCWAGKAGGLDYAWAKEFELRTDKGMEPVFRGKVALRVAKEAEEDAYGANHNGADVYEMDFSGFSKPGRYRLCVPGLGCSHPFEIKKQIWSENFVVAMKGFYHLRSGMALGPPYTTYRRPKTFAPGMGMKLFHSGARLMDTGNGPAEPKTEPTNFGKLNELGTDREIPMVAGGTMDAGDWDRRIQHLDASRLLLELYSFQPRMFDSLKLNIPEKGNGLPDMVDEALYNLDFYRRLQTKDGGVRGGIESEEHPRLGEASWQESLKVYAYAPGIWSTYVYAGVAARAAWALRKKDSALARRYHRSALKSMRWAEERWKEGKDRQFFVRDARNLAAAELYRLEGGKRWHQIFLETTAFREPVEPFEWKKWEQHHAAWVYATTRRKGMNKIVQVNARAGILRWAERLVEGVRRTGYGWTQFEYRPFTCGTMTSPDAVSLVRAHRLTGEPRYLNAILSASLPGLGANPNNVVYTTGFERSIRHPLHLDSRLTGQPPPDGITVCGPWDLERLGPGPFDGIYEDFFHPRRKKWPLAETFYDVYWHSPICEYTVHMPMARTAFVWGYLASRP